MDSLEGLLLLANVGKKKDLKKCSEKTKVLQIFYYELKSKIQLSQTMRLHILHQRNSLIVFI